MVTFGEPSDCVSYDREDWNQLPVKIHPVDDKKYAKIQPLFFVAKVGYFIFFKTCTEKGKINDAHEYVK